MKLQYIVVQERKKETLEAEVQSRLDEGWEPQGGVSVDGVGMGTLLYVQALILKSN